MILSRTWTIRTTAAHLRIWQQVAQMMTVHRQRRQLARLDDTQLTDIGLSRAAAETEAARKPWDVPQHWQG